MSEPLALKYRPRKFSEIIGQKINAVVLDRMVESDEVPHGLLFSGPRGSGKTSTARILAQALGDSEPVEVDAASHGLVGDVRELVSTLRYSSGSKYRIIILDEAHSMTKEAFNALLKTLEEPPAGTIFVLVTTEPEKIPETVKSRLMEFTFRKITPEVIRERLTLVRNNEKISIEDELLAYLSVRADGSARDALMMLDQCHRAGITDKQNFLQMIGEDEVTPELVLEMMTGDYQRVFQLTDELSQRVPDPMKLTNALTNTLKEILVLKSGGTLDLPEDKNNKLRALALNLESERIVAAMRMLWDLRTKVKQSVDPRSNLDLALVLITDIFSQGRQIAPTIPKRDNAHVRPESRRLSFEEL